MTCASCARRCECRLFHGVASLSLPFEQFPSTFSDALSVEEMGFLGGKNTGDRSRAAEKSILFRRRNREILGQPEISISSVKHLIPATPLIQANLTNDSARFSNPGRIWPSVHSCARFHLLVPASHATSICINASRA